MGPPTITPKRFAIYYHPDVIASAQALAYEISDFLERHGAKTTTFASLHDEELQQKVSQDAFDVLIALGGDGTMLRAGPLCAQSRLPVLGINTGSFGFLTEVKEDDWCEDLHKLLDGDYRLENRLMLHAEHWRAEGIIQTWDALNEVLVGRGYEVRPIHLDVSVDGLSLSTYVADGLIAATPTGSTAYSLAAGGPILLPELHNFLLIPVAPHFSIDRALILSKDSRVRIIPHTRYDAILSIDGQTPIPMLDGDHIDVFAGKNMVSFIRFQNPGYFFRHLARYMERNPSVGTR
ncbi:MAG: NAD(+)/NADH kinase [Anaerolineaceae bacterium]|nr:NAD(+)/NADH kinase [Anaerolineaceae bacterium]